MDLICELGQLL